MNLSALIEELPTERRLALSYAPVAARAANCAVLALDVRLARIVSQGHEPLLGQMRLAWWRDRLGVPVPAGGLGDPLLALFAGWRGPLDGLVALVDGWEALLADSPLPAAAVLEFAQGRAQAFGSLAVHLNCTDHVAVTAAAANGWALAELAIKTSDQSEAALVRELARHTDWQSIRLPRLLRPLKVLHGLAARQQGRGPLLGNFTDGLVALRLGLLGR